MTQFPQLNNGVIAKDKTKQTILLGLPQGPDEHPHAGTLEGVSRHTAKALQIFMAIVNMTTVNTV